jgi:urea transport system permease protein
MSIIGAVYGTLIVNWAKTTFSESFPELWLFAMGALFIGVVMAFPTGLAGLYKNQVEPFLTKTLTKIRGDYETRFKNEAQVILGNQEN